MWRQVLVVPVTPFYGSAVFYSMATPRFVLPPVKGCLYILLKEPGWHNAV